MKFVKPPMDLMRRLLHEHPDDSTDIALDVYCSPNPLLRQFFWLRLWMIALLIRRHAERRERCLDFGGGSGVLLPTLCSGFETVHLIDRNARGAEELQRALGLENAIIRAADIEETDFSAQPFDAIVAADVLQHFPDLGVPVTKLREWLRHDGRLYTSLPTENFFYRLMRVIFRKTKPPDHFRSAREVEDYLTSQGFRKVSGICHPLFVPVFPLFRISVWARS